MSIKICCDFCNRPLPVETITDEFGLCDVAKHFHTREVNTRKLFPMLCENCATKLDRVMVFVKDEQLKQIDISVRNSRINAARRRILDTKG